MEAGNVCSVSVFFVRVGSQISPRQATKDLNIPSPGRTRSVKCPTPGPTKTIKSPPHALPPLRRLYIDRCIRACLHGGEGLQVAEKTCGESPHLSCKCDQIKMRDYMDWRVTSPSWGPPPPCKQALIKFTYHRISLAAISSDNLNLTGLFNFILPDLVFYLLVVHTN